VNILSVTRAQYPADLQRVVSETTGGLQSDSKTKLAQLRTDMIKNKYDTQGQIVYSALQEQRGNQASVLIYAAADKVSDSAGPLLAGTYRFQVTLGLKGGHWLANDLISVGLA
jgi:exosome complex RNA-binding protein Csl4